MVERWGKQNIARLARDANIDRSSIYSWQDGADVEPATVGATAAALGANPIAAYIAAGYFTEAEFDAYRATGVERGVSNRALADEVLRRMNSRGDSPCGWGGSPRHDGGPDVASLPPTQGVDVAITDDPAQSSRARERES